MAVYVATLRETFVGQECINRFGYVSTVEPTGITGSFGLAKHMGAFDLTDGAFADGTLLRAIQLIQGADVQFNELQVMNLYDPADFTTVPWPTGVVGADAESPYMSPFVSVGLHSNRVTRAIRQGTRRFTGVPVVQVGEEGALVPTYLALVQDVADEMSSVLNPLNAFSEGVYTPSVLSYKSYTTPKGNKAYKPWPTEAEQLGHAALGVTWSPYPQVRSQVSRQYGRGA